MEPWALAPIATVNSPFQEKFGIPRQSGLTQIRTQLRLCPERVQPSALHKLEQGSHLWLIFGFHAIEAVPQAATVRPPRLGGNQRRGVYSTRSPFRPNRLGLSLVRLHARREMILEVSGADLLDQTPIFDIKPYLEYCDRPAQAQHWAQEPPPAVAVRASATLQERINASAPLARLWEQVQDYLRWDPRPSYRGLPDPRLYHQRYAAHEIHFRRDQAGILVEAIQPALQESP